MRKVFTPPEMGSSWGRTAVFAMAITFAVFLVLPLTQMLSTLKKPDSDGTELTAIDNPPDPPPPPEEEPPPEEPPQEEPPPPDLQPQNMDLSLSDLDVDLAGLTGGGLLAGGFDPSAVAADALSDLQVFDVSDLDNKPTPISQAAPRHPTDLLKSRVEGSVVLTFVVDEQGRVQNAQVESSSHPGFEKPALEAVRKWRFKPGMKEGAPVKAYVKQPIRFGISS